MKKLNSLVLVALCAGLFSGCALKKMIKLSEQQKIQVAPDPLELHGREVSYDVSVELPPKMLPKGKVYTLKFSYKTDTSEKEMGDMVFSASDYPNSKNSPSKQEKTFSLDYQDTMRRGTMMVQGVASNPANGKSLDTEKNPLVEGMITSSQLVSPVQMVSYADHGYNDQEEMEENNASIFFEKGRSNITREETRSDHVKAFGTFIAERNITRKVSIMGYHSPEGPETINTDLSRERSEVVMKWYRQQLAKYDYKDLAKDIDFENSAIVRNWKPFRRVLKDYEGLSEEDKEKVLAVVDGVGVFEDKELALQKFSFYGKLAEELYPLLRTSKVVVWTVKKKRSNEEIIAFSIDEKSREELSSEEVLYGASFTPSLKEKAAIYEVAIAKGDSWVAHNNMGAVLLSMASQTRNKKKMEEYITKGVTHLEIASKSAGDPTAEVLGNLAVAYLMRDNVDRAYDNLTQAIVLRPSNETLEQINAVKGTIEMRKGDYEKAFTSYQMTSKDKDVLFNRGLLALLTKDYEEAEKRLNAVIRMDASYAKAYYVLAIKNAYEKKEQAMAKNLMKAVQYDASLKERAIEDLVFKSYPTILKKL